MSWVAMSPSRWTELGDVSASHGSVWRQCLFSFRRSESVGWGVCVCVLASLREWSRRDGNDCPGLGGTGLQLPTCEGWQIWRTTNYGGTLIMAIVDSKTQLCTASSPLVCEPKREQPLPKCCRLGCRAMCMRHNSLFCAGHLICFALGNF